MQFNYHFLKILVPIYLFLYGWYLRIWETLISIIGPLHIVYYFDGNKFTNITFSYYLRWISSRYHSGSYFCKFLLKNRVDQFVYTGKISDVRSILAPDILPKSKRPNIMLYQDSKPQEVNLNVLDNYVSNMHYHKQKFTVKNSLVLSRLGLNCTHVQTTVLRPFSKITKPIDEVRLEELYTL